MARLSIWNSGRKGNTYKYTDKQISQFFSVSGTAVYVHLYEGVYDQEDWSNGAVMADGTSSIQDPLLLENRDRKYSDYVYELRGTYNIADLDFDLRQFGIFLQNDTMFLSVHLNDMIACLGRRIVSGDVIELPHRRDDTAQTEYAFNKFYVVKDANHSSEGYGSSWYSHIWRLKLEPMPAGQEYQDILDKPLEDGLGLPIGNGITIGDIISTEDKENEINEQVVENAKKNFLNRNFETQQFWVLPGEEITGQDPWVYAGDAIPPNGYLPIGSGPSFPSSGFQIGDYYVRTDYSPVTLFRRAEYGWKKQEVNYRIEWSPAHRVLENFFDNKKENTFKDGTVHKERQSLSKVVTKIKPDL